MAEKDMIFKTNPHGNDKKTEITMAAEQGDAEAQYKLGQIYEKSRDVEKDEIEAAEWYEKAAVQGHVKAQYALGHLYETGYSDSDFDFLPHVEGKFVCQDFEKAYKWYREAALQEYAGAQYRLGKMCEEGRGVEQNDKEAAEWYRKAAERGYVKALYALGGLYEDGHGVEQNEGEALEWYRKAAAQGYKEALLYLGYLYDEDRVELEYYEIIECYKMMAEKGDELEHESGIIGLEEAARDGDSDIRDYLKEEWGIDVR